MQRSIVGTMATKRFIELLSADLGTVAQSRLRPKEPTAGDLLALIQARFAPDLDHISALMAYSLPLTPAQAELLTLHNFTLKAAQNG